MGLLAYFDLNQRSRKARRQESQDAVIAATTLPERRESAIVAEADSASSTSPLAPPTSASSRGIPTWEPEASPSNLPPPNASECEPAPTKPARSFWILITQRQDGQLSIVDQLVMYFGVLLGVYFSSLIRGSQSQASLLIAALVALVIIPVVFEKLNVNPKAPFIVRFGLFVQNGVFWDVIFESIGKIGRS